MTMHLFRLYTGPTEVEFWANRLRLTLAGSMVFAGTEHCWVRTERDIQEIRCDMKSAGLPFWIVNNFQYINSHNGDLYEKYEEG